MMISDYLKRNGAIGRENAIPAGRIARELKISRRQLTEKIGAERGQGALICSLHTGLGGYYLPANEEEIKRQHDALEKGFAMHARAIRPFRAYTKAHRKKE